MPVNRPGPTSTAMHPISPSSMSDCRHTNSIAGVSVSAWRRPLGDLERGDHALVAADRDADLLGRGLDAQDQHAAQHGRSASERLHGARRSGPSGRPTPRRPRAARSRGTRSRRTRRRRRRRSSSGSSARRPSSSSSTWSSRTSRWSPSADAGDVAPLDEHDPVERRQLVQRQVVDVARAVEPVEVGVVQRQPVATAGSCARA